MGGIVGGTDGCLTLDRTGAGQFTGRLIFKGVEHAMSGAVDGSGSYSGVVGPAKLPVTLKLVSAGTPAGAGGYRLVGTVEGVEFTALHSAYGAGQVAPEAGEYSVVLETGNPSTGTVRKAGYALLRVSASGETIYSGRLTAGAGFSGSATLLAGPDGTQLKIYSLVTTPFATSGIPKGLIVGTLKFEKLPAGALGGTLKWVQLRSGNRPDGGTTETSLEAVGSIEVASDKSGNSSP